MIDWFLNLFRVPPLSIDLARIQLEERTQRREALERDLSGRDAEDCMRRVKLRMTYGDTVWVQPLYNVREHLDEWLSRKKRA